MIGRASVVVALAVVAYVIFAPLPEGFETDTFVPPPLPAVEPNNLLQDRGQRFYANFNGPESVAFDAEGYMYTGQKDGRILRSLRPDDYTSGNFTVFARTGLDDPGCGKAELLPVCGRPLGLRFDSAGNLIVAAAYKGILSVDRSGAVTVLTQSFDGRPFGFIDDVTVARTGEIYFTDACHKRRYHELVTIVLEYQPCGRVYKYDPATKQTSLVKDRMFFANGIQLSPQEDFLLVNELLAFRIVKIHLKGPLEGESEVWVDNVPGTPDNIRYDSVHRLYWVGAGATRRSPFNILAFLAPRPWLRTLVAKVVPPSLFQSPAPSIILAYDEAAKVVHTIQDQSGDMFALTEAHYHDGFLYVGSYLADYLIKFPMAG